jgi:MOSC domain-containing protein YiiM
MVAQSAVVLKAGAGIRGDRYFDGRGTFSDWPRDHELTLVEAEALEAAAAEYGITFTAGETRRNITTRGIALNLLVGRRFRIGDILCEGTRLCHPCAHLELATARGGLARVLANRGGLRARVLGEGEIKIGDVVEETERE